MCLRLQIHPLSLGLTTYPSSCFIFLIYTCIPFIKVRLRLKVSSSKIFGPEARSIEDTLVTELHTIAITFDLLDNLNSNKKNRWLSPQIIQR